MSNRIKFCGQCGAALVQRLVEKEGIQRLCCSNAPACNFIFYNNPTPVVGAIVEHGDSVVLVRNVGWPDTWFGLVTGFLEARECPRAGILREVKEEIGAYRTAIAMRTLSIRLSILTYSISIVYPWKVILELTPLS
jgi:NAD+ diphosphatase